MEFESREKILRVRALTPYHFIAGLPRAGAGLLSALLQQNPRFVVPPSSPAQMVFTQLFKQFSPQSEIAPLLDTPQRQALLRGVLDAVHHNRPLDSVVFDSNREWLLRADQVSGLFPLSRFILCVRNPAAVVNSLEVQRRASAWTKASSTGDDPDLGARLNMLLARDGLVGSNLTLLRDALIGPHSERMIVIDYDRLLSDPEEVLEVVYDFLRERWFEHDFEDFSYEMPAAAATGNAAKPAIISGPVRPMDTEMVLPNKVIRQLSGRAFWRKLRRTEATMLLGRGHL